jgi:hypothetical protein
MSHPSICGVLIAVIGVTIHAASTAMALDDRRAKHELLELDPQSRLEQTCDTEVMLRITRDSNPFNVDKVIAYTFGEPIMGENSINAPGAVFRSSGNWYHLSYVCVTGPKHLDAHFLRYRIGAKIPRAQWAMHDLYD